MSLINDAIKQASQHQKKNPPPPSPLQMRPADASPRRNYTPPAILFAVLLVVLALGGILIGYALQKRSESLVVNARHENPPPQPELPTAKETVSPVVAKKPETVFVYVTNLPVAPVANPAATTATEPTPPAPSTNVVAAPVEPPKPVGPKLQGISYNPSRPSAVVNGKTVYVGDRVLEFRVTQISQETVTLVSDTETKVLGLSQ